jgi:hypothetical protein
MNKQFLLILVVLLVALLLTGCADVNLAEDNLQLCQRNLSGFWWGLWHGIVAPIAFIGSLFDSDIAIYDVCNVGGWYDFGFCLGIGAFTKGSHSAASAGKTHVVDRFEWGGEEDEEC